MNTLSPILTGDTIRLDLDVVSRKRLFEEAGLILELSSGVSHTETFDALIARERLGSTCIGSGCAIPHGRIKELASPQLAFIRTLAPLQLDAPDGRPVSLFFCLLVPAEDNGEYLRLLRECAALLSDKSIKTALIQAKEPIDVWNLIQDWTPPADLHLADEFPDPDDESDDESDTDPSDDNDRSA